MKEAGYDNWSTGYEGSAPQPDNENGNEHCGSMYRDGTLNDVNCDTKAMFICEKILSPSFLEGLPSKLSLPDVLVNRFSSMDIY